MRVGDLLVSAVSDGTFVIKPSYFGNAATGQARPDFFEHGGAAWLPIGSFVIHSSKRTVLVDAGLGPEAQQLPDGMFLIGGQLLTGLRAAGITPTDITDVVCTHLHSDHVGWLFNTEAAPVFSNAAVWFGAADWDAFIEGGEECAPHIRQGFKRCQGTQRLRPLRTTVAIAEGVTAVPAPGHTPGSIYVEIVSGAERILLLGDAITCPIQLQEPTWHSFGDLDPAAAQRTRKHLWAQLSDGGTQGVGAHFPQLQPGRVVQCEWCVSGGGDKGDAL
jgi:glyoxylase-like metal-dependent hydrolase (beta-lactamase superfamily II)